MNQIFEIFADGKKVGISVAPGLKQANSAAISAMTRRTDSKFEGTADYKTITAVPMPIKHEVVVEKLSRPLFPNGRRRGDRMQEIAFKSMHASTTE